MCAKVNARPAPPWCYVLYACYRNGLRVLLLRKRRAVQHAEKQAVRGYKALARKACVGECLVSDNPLRELVVDIRSRVFMYMRTRYLSVSLKDKVGRVFTAMSDLEEERKRAFRTAIAIVKQEVSFMGVRKVTYVFGSQTPVPTRSP